MIRPAVERFEADLDPANPTGCAIIAYGEVSAVLVLPDHPGVVLKRMAGFHAHEVPGYIATVGRYIEELGARSVEVLPTELVPVGQVVYLVQPRLPVEALGNQVLATGSTTEVFALLAAVYERLTAVYAQNDGGVQVALDAQLSNWGWQGGALCYLDVSTPFLRLDGQEQMPWGLMSRSTPRLFGLVGDALITPGVVRRYYTLHQVLTDILANFVKEGRADLLPEAVRFTNDWAARAGHDLAFEVASIERYYTGDARIWELISVSRRFARWTTTRLLRRRYDYLLPGKVKRR